MKINNLIIGTANFNSKYGFKKHLYSKSELNEIFNILEKNKINSFDTAQSYGSSEEILGNKKKINIFTKLNLPNVKINKFDLEVNKLINKSLKNLKRKKLEGILIHNSDFFIKNKNYQSKVLNILKKLRKRKIIKKIGFSIYTPNELKEIVKIFIPNFFQIPINVLDQRFINGNIINKISKHKIEIHARSIFLQGKILKRNKFHSPLVNKKVNDFHSWCSENKVTKIGACINFIRNYKFINKIIVGIDNKSQLKTIIKEMRKKKYFVPNKFKMNKFNLIDPRKKK